jgi:hypothetical protein
MKIELLYFEGCTAYQTALKHLEEVIQEKKLNAGVEMVKLKNDKQAREQRFLGSPTIRINGQDIEPDAQQIREFSIRCRLYLEGDRVNEWPGKELMRHAIEQALQQKE